MGFSELIEPRTTIALLALFIAFWSIKSSRKHNRISVRPLLYDSLQSDSVSLECSLSLINKGLGPAIIKERYYYVDGTPIEFHRLLDIFETKPTEFGFYLHDIKAGSAISKDEVHNIVAVKWDSLKYKLPEEKDLKLTITKDLEAFARVISEKVTVKVVYESGYGERCELVSAPKT